MPGEERLWFRMRVLSPESRRHRSWLAGSLESVEPLREEPYRQLWLGQGASAFGEALVPVAVAFATLRIAGGSPALLGLVLGAGAAAQTAALPVGGVLGDRLPRQAVMVTAGWVRAVVLSALAVLVLAGRASVWELMVAMLANGLAGALFRPAATAVVPSTVSAARLQPANALIALSRSTSQICAPILAGVLVAAFDPGWAFAGGALAFVIAAVSLGRLRLPRTARAGRSGLWDELSAGWREIAVRPWYLSNLGVHALGNVGIAAFLVLGPVVTSRSPRGSASWGLIAASIAGGTVIGGVIALRILPRRPLVVANLAVTLAAVQLVALALSLPTPVIMATTAVGFAGVSFLNRVWATVMQQLIPLSVLARVSSFDWALSMVAMPLGYALSGSAAGRIGVPPTLTMAALVLALPSALVVLVPGVRAVRRLPDGTVVGPAARAQMSPAGEPS